MWAGVRCTCSMQMQVDNSAGHAVLHVHAAHRRAASMDAGEMGPVAGVLADLLRR